MAECNKNKIEFVKGRLTFSRKTVQQQPMLYRLDSCGIFYRYLGEE